MAKFEPGQSGNPGGRPKSKQLRDLCRAYTAEGVEELRRLALNATGEMTRVKAWELILAYGHGRPMQASEVTIEDNRVEHVDTIPLTPDEVLVATGNMLSKAEKQMGLDPVSGHSNEERMKRLVQSGKPLPPDLYEAWQRVAPELKKTGPGARGSWQ